MQPDVVHAHGAKGGVYGRLGAAFERRKGRSVAAFYAPHGGSLHYDRGSLSGRIFFAVERGLERLTDGLIHVSAYEAQTYRQKVGVPRCPAHVVLNGLRSGGIRSGRRQRPDAADFLFIGELRDLKGVDVFIEAMAASGRGAAAPRAAIVGPGDARGCAPLSRHGECEGSKRPRRLPSADAGARRPLRWRARSCFPRERNRCPIWCWKPRRLGCRSSPPTSAASRRSSPARRSALSRRATRRSCRLDAGGACRP